MIVLAALCILSIESQVDSSEDEPWLNDPATSRVSSSSWDFARNDRFLRRLLVRLREKRRLLRDIRSGQDKRRIGTISSGQPSGSSNNHHHRHCHMHCVESGHNFGALARLYEAQSICYQHDSVRKYLLRTGFILCHLRRLPCAIAYLHSMECANIEGS